MADRKNLVFEIGTEELPALPLYKATAQMQQLVEEGLKKTGLGFKAVRTESTPRRITTYIDELEVTTTPVEESLRGPAAAMAFDANGNPTPAALGFARGKGVDASQLKVREQDGKEYVFVDISIPARPATEIIPEVLSDAAGKLAWPRSQRWGTHTCRFSRPVRWLLCLFGDEVVPVEFCDLVAGNTTRGNRLMNPNTYEVPSADAYNSVLESVHVMVAAKDRERVIREGIAKIEQEQGLKASTPKKTFDEVINLVEWPTVIVAHFDEEFLHVPHEIICESMLSNQRYFPLNDANGELTNSFVLVSNGDPSRNSVIADGNERVVRARLADAKFFYEEDLKQPLEAYVEKLATVGFQEKLGTMLQKTKRVEKLATAIARSAATREVVQNVRRAAYLAKADLVTGAVVEFTSQQGVMGGYYATASGEDPDVALAISQQYRPRFAGDELPSGLVGKLVAMADKLDTVCGIFAIDEAPTGSSDPFAVRRSAIGIINILLAEPDFSLEYAIQCAIEGLEQQGLEFNKAKITQQVRNFFVGRLTAIARDEGVEADTVEAVKAVDVIEPSIFLARAHALEDARTQSPEVFDDLASAYTRANNLRDASLGSEPKQALMGECELDLLNAVDTASNQVTQALASEGGYSKAIEALASLRGPIDSFFDSVMVMDENLELRNMRLELLNRFVAVFRDVADIGKMEKRS